MPLWIEAVTLTMESPHWYGSEGAWVHSIEIGFWDLCEGGGYYGANRVVA